jgi:glycosyltransferase involved in cell wall biosynthesis/ubiquinone/menaquinone biosynthesis C-methylase UbiE
MSDFFIKGHTSFIGQTGYNAHARDFFTALSYKTPLKLRNFTVGKTWKGLGPANPDGTFNDPHTNEAYMTDYQRGLICEQTLYCNEGSKGRYGSGICDHEINGGGNTYLKEYEEKDIFNIILSETGHHYFHCIDKYKGFKIAYNVWESTRYSDNFFDLLKQYDQFWVPSEWQRQCAINQGYPSNKIFVVPEAVDGTIYSPQYFNYDLDLYKDNRFKFILVGRWEYRKATREIIETFLKTFKEDEPVDLILSVDNSDYSVDGMKTTEERLKHFNFNDDRLKVLHFLRKEEYINYLRNGHVFLSCARSEGWNLPLIEAMACGTPAIYSNCSGQLEFAQGKGHPVKILGEKPVPNGIGNYFEPDFDDLSKVMRDVYTNYWKYKSIALQHSYKIRKQFSWENAANKAYEILDATHRGEIINIIEPIVEPDIIIENIDDLNYDNITEQRFWNNLSEWKRDGEEWSDIFGGTEKTWNEKIYPKIKDYLKGEVLEIAPGHGRITEYLLKYTINLSIVDLNETCIDKCKERFTDKIRKYSVNNGKNLNDFKNDSFDFVISWDSFVHMDRNVIQSYLNEIYRVLKPDGVGYIHHSSFFDGSIKSFENTSGRSNMNAELFKELLENSNLNLVSQENIQGYVLDVITTFKK